MSEVNGSTFFQDLQAFWREFVKDFKKAMRNFMKAFTRWIDPKLEKYRSKSSAKSATKDTPNIQTDEQITSEDSEAKDTGGLAEKSEPAEVINPVALEPEVPQTKAEFQELLANVPISVFTQKERRQFEAMSHLETEKISNLMLPASKIVYVKKEETIGPLVLDRLFRSGLEHFPVKDGDEIIGCIHTARLNSLNVRETNTAEEILDPGIYYIRKDYTLEQALDTFLRNEAHFALVVDDFGKIVGILNFADVCKYLFGDAKNEGFSRDDDRIAVAKRKFAIDLEEPEKEEKTKND